MDGSIDVFAQKLTPVARKGSTFTDWEDYPVHVVTLRLQPYNGTGKDINVYLAPEQANILAAKLWEEAKSENHPIDIKISEIAPDFLDLLNKEGRTNACRSHKGRAPRGWRLSLAEKRRAMEPG